MLYKRIPIAFLAAVASFTHVSQAALVIDQQNTTGGSQFGITNSFTAAQTFTPSLNLIEAAEFHLRDVPGGGSSAAFVNLYSDLPGAGFSGATLLSTSTVSASVTNPTFESYLFEFPSPIALVPGELYALQIVATAADGVQIEQSPVPSDPYPAGEVRTSTSNLNRDFVFAEGVLQAAEVIPEPCSVFVWSIMAALAIVATRRSSLMSA